MQINFYIRQIDSNEWQQYKDLRLLALQLHPNIYTSTFKNESNYWIP